MEEGAYYAATHSLSQPSTPYFEDSGNESAAAGKRQEPNISSGI